MVRRFVGHHRYSGPLAGQMLVQLYQSLRLYVNYFQPSFKLVEKNRVACCLKIKCYRRVKRCVKIIVTLRVSMVEPVPVATGVPVPC